MFLLSNLPIKKTIHKNILQWRYQGGYCRMITSLIDISFIRSIVALIWPSLRGVGSFNLFSLIHFKRFPLVQHRNPLRSQNISSPSFSLNRLLIIQYVFYFAANQFIMNSCWLLENLLMLFSIFIPSPSIKPYLVT